MRRLALLLLLSATACAPLTARRPSMTEVTEQEWRRTLEQAQVAADSGRHVDADLLLATFASQHAGTPQATSTLFWRGLLRLDPANRAHEVSEALDMFDAYLVAQPIDSATASHRLEAAVLRRTAMELERLERAISTAASALETATRQAAAAAAAAKPADNAKDEEIARLRKELEAANDELTRIKRRLSPGRP